MTDLQNKLVVVFGGGGFVGRHIAQRLLGMGARVRIAQRNPAAAASVRALGNLGQTQFVAVDVRDDAGVRRAVTGADVVINLVAVLKGDMDGLHIAGARHVAEAAAAVGAGALVHISAIGADAGSASDYGRTKGLGEDAVRAAFPAATILRPSVIFGREDQFTNRFAGLIRMLPVVPVIAPDTLFQPVFVGDVATAAAMAAGDAARFGGQTFELGGPEALSMLALQEWIAERTGRTPAFVPVPALAAEMLAKGTGWAPGAPITYDQWLMLQSDNVVALGNAGFAAFGISPTPLDAVADAWLTPYRRHGRFAGKAKAAA